MNFHYLVTGTAILNDTIAQNYGINAQLFGLVSGTAVGKIKRDASYKIAEQFAMRHIGSFLVPTTVTGTFNILEDYRVHLPFGRIRSIDSVTFVHQNTCACGVSASTIEIAGCAYIYHAEAGIVALADCLGNWYGRANCTCLTRFGQGVPDQVRIAVTAGFGAGEVAANDAALLGLTIAAELALEQMADPSAAEGGPGDPSISSFSDSGYSETRQFLYDTEFGGSPRANYAARMLQPLRFSQALRLS